MGAAITEQNDGYIWQKPTGAPSTLASRITDSPRSRRALMKASAAAASAGCS